MLFVPVTSEPMTDTPVIMSQEGRLTVGLKPEGSVFGADGTLLGRTPLVKKRMPAGSHRLVLRSRDGALERRVTVEVHPETTTVYRFSLGKGDR